MSVERLVRTTCPVCKAEGGFHEDALHRDPIDLVKADWTTTGIAMEGEWIVITHTDSSGRNHVTRSKAPKPKHVLAPLSLAEEMGVFLAVFEAGFTIPTVDAVNSAIAKFEGIEGGSDRD